MSNEKCTNQNCNCSCHHEPIENAGLTDVGPAYDDDLWNPHERFSIDEQAIGIAQYAQRARAGTP